VGTNIKLGGKHTHRKEDDFTSLLTKINGKINRQMNRKADKQTIR
jgi:hypothetical protein